MMAKVIECWCSTKAWVFPDLSGFFQESWWFTNVKSIWIPSDPTKSSNPLQCLYFALSKSPLNFLAAAIESWCLSSSINSQRTSDTIKKRWRLSRLSEGLMEIVDTWDVKSLLDLGCERLWFSSIVLAPSLVFVVSYLSVEGHLHQMHVYSDVALSTPT